MYDSLSLSLSRSRSRARALSLSLCSCVYVRVQATCIRAKSPASITSTTAPRCNIWWLAGLSLSLRPPLFLLDTNSLYTTLMRTTNMPL